MIFITTQGKGESGAHESVLDGSFITGSTQQKQIGMLLDLLSQNNINGNNEIFCSVQDKYFCVLKHLQKDDAGRTRLSMILHDKNEKVESIKESLRVAGLRYDDYQLAKEKAKKPNIAMTIIMIVFIVIVAFLAMRFLQ